jgi:hypothetical protein
VLKKPYTAPALEYFHGEAALALERIYRDNATPEGEAFRDRLIFTINTYCQDHANAGAQVASFVEDIPFPEEVSAEDALLARHVLLETQAALKSLLEDDAEFLESYRGDTVPDDRTDASVREDAREFDKRYKLDKEAIIRESAQEGSATDDEVSNSFYNGQNAERVESDVAHSARDRGFAEQVKVPAADPPLTEPPVSDVAPTIAASSDSTSEGTDDKSLMPTPAGEGLSKPKEAAPSNQLRPKEQPVKPVSIRPTIKAPDFLGGSPSMVFNQAKQWLIDHIIQVASGTTKDGEFPRIAPLMEISEGLPYRVSVPELRAIVADIRASVRRIRPPLVESFDSLLDLAEKLKRKGPGGGGNIGDAIDAFNDVLDAFKTMHGDPDEDRYGLGNNDWKKDGGGSDDDF